MSYLEDRIGIKSNDQLYKADAGKLRPSLLIEGAPKALLLVAAVLTYGAQKYEPNSWRRVAGERYKDAKYRHMFEEILKYKPDDAESGLLHDAHELTNAIFILEKKLEGISEREFRKLLKFKQPPQEHKNV